MSLLNPKALLPWAAPQPAPRRAEIWPPPAHAWAGPGLSVFVRGCRTGFKLLGSPQWRYVWVEVEVENTAREPIALPRGRQVVLVDSVGYAYRDLNAIGGKGMLVRGKRRRMRYLFKAPADITIGKLRLMGPDAKPIAETGFVDLTIPAS